MFAKVWIPASRKYEIVNVEQLKKFNAEKYGKRPEDERAKKAYTLTKIAGGNSVKCQVLLVGGM